MIARFAFFLIILVSIIRKSTCSSGDRLYIFQSCLDENEHLCNGNEYPAILPFYLCIFGWKCMDEIKYQCMHNVTSVLLESGYSVQQFYGKWPFLRFFGVQEPASTLFSLANMIAHIFGYHKFSSNVTKQYKFYDAVKLLFIVQINAWVWSTAYHTRDVAFTEKMDYFCGTLAVLSSIAFCFVRMVGDPQKPICYGFALVISVIYAHHIYKLGFVKFDYKYNMKFSIICGILNLLMWLHWCFKKRKERPYVWKCAFAVVATFFCIGLEVFDFPPVWWTFDAHSLWHLSTIPLCFVFDSFLVDDGKYEMQQTSELKKTA